MDYSRREWVAWASVAFVVAASWVWAVGQVAGPAPAHRLAFWLGIAAVLGSLTAAGVALRRSDRDARHTALAAAFVCLLAASGAAAGAHITGSPVSGTVTIQTNDGLAVRVSNVNEMLLEDPQTLSGTANVYTEQGNMTVFSSGSAGLSVDAAEIEGTWTNVSSVSASSNSIDIDPDDKSQATVAQNVDNFSYKGDYAIDDGTVDFVYGASATGEVTVEGDGGSATLVAVDTKPAGDPQWLDSATASGGTVTFDALDSGKQQNVEVQTLNNHAPTLSNASPQGDISNPPTTLSIDVKDGDFPNGDTVTVTFDVDGNQVDQQTISSNQTVTTSVPASGQTGGSHTWAVDATDDFGGSTSNSYSYSVPDQLTFREEQPDHPIIKNTYLGAIECEATLFEDVETSPEIVRRTTTDGNISLTGLPVSSKFSVSVSCPGYHNRTTVIDDIFVQSDVFLINKNETTIENRFSVSDRTGNFPEDSTELVVQAPINETKYKGSGGINWLNVAGDDIGADTAFTTDLIDEKRYRLRVQNDDGDTRILGAYTAETSGTIALDIGSVSVQPQEPNGTAWSANWTNTTVGSPKINVQYNDTADNTTTLYLHIYERNNESNELLVNTSYTAGPYGTFSTTETVPKGENDTTWVVELTGDKSSGENFHITKPVGPGAPVLTDLPAWMVTLLFVGSMWVVAGLFSQLNGHVGGLVVAGLGAMFYFVGLVPGYLGTGVMVLAMLTAGVMFVRGARGGGL